jgi:hypothetical protein
MTTQREVIKKNEQGFKTFGKSNINKNESFSISVFDSEDELTQELKQHTEIFSNVKKQKFTENENLFISTISNEVNKRTVLKIKFKTDFEISKGTDLSYVFEREEFVDDSQQENSTIVSPDKEFINLNYKSDLINEK